jgi:hypothetical protein
VPPLAWRADAALLIYITIIPLASMQFSSMKTGNEPSGTEDDPEDS